MSKVINWAEIDRLVLAHHRENPTGSIESLERYLRKWWCLQYNRPFKDPLLDQYSLDELAYEFLTKHYLKPEHDPDKVQEIKDIQQDDEAWAARMIQEELKKMEGATGNVMRAADDLKQMADRNPAKIHAKMARSKSKKKQQPELPEISTKFDVADDVPTK